MSTQSEVDAAMQQLADLQQARREATAEASKNDSETDDPERDKYVADEQALRDQIATLESQLQKEGA